MASAYDAVEPSPPPRSSPTASSSSPRRPAARHTGAAVPSDMSVPPRGAGQAPGSSRCAGATNYLSRFLDTLPSAAPSHHLSRLRACVARREHRGSGWRRRGRSDPRPRPRQQRVDIREPVPRLPEACRGTPSQPRSPLAPPRDRVMATHAFNTQGAAPREPLEDRGPH